ncbi:hypothetical protein B0A49_02339 [Cryomyces minteri]|uniref:Helicase C-terminal domain-containing protein n=1 Tax=Cryomyces minteri TaxID=331657 RepID=A0A4U0XTR2_9PEZI|nr:hypothetical protein B0A49_02339 [Cryomyces minteri]
MAPDRGLSSDHDSMASAEGSTDQDESLSDSHAALRSIAQAEMNKRTSEPQNFTVRSIIVGLLIGVVIAFSNTYFGLQTGWVSGMAMPSALIGFAFFRTLSKHLNYPFTPVENVLVQTVAGSVGTMPLGCGFVGVVPALEFLLRPGEVPEGQWEPGYPTNGGERGGLNLGLGKLIVWAVGICFFGVVFAVPLRKEVIIREKLKFPSGTATALMIGVLHGEKQDSALVVGQENGDDALRRRKTGSNQEDQSLMDGNRTGGHYETQLQQYPENESGEETGTGMDTQSDWRAKIRLLIISFGISGFYTLLSYFVPHLRDIPFLGLPLANNWLWTLNPSPAYVGQGIIMGPATTLHMLLGAIVGWAILSPLAKSKGWAPGPVSDWGTGSKGWIVWISLAIMLSDSVVSLGWLVLRPLVKYAKIWTPKIMKSIRRGTWREDLRSLRRRRTKGYSTIDQDGPYDGSEQSTPFTENSPPDRASPPFRHRSSAASAAKFVANDNEPDIDAPPEHLVSNRVTLIGLTVSLIVCVGAVHYTFGALIPLPLTLLALLLALLLSVMGVRALGETDLNPVSGISKLTQLFFAFATPKGNKNAVIINLLAGAISESGALQAGDLLQDLKTGHLLGAAPKAQFYGQLIGSAVGAVVSAAVYKLYTRVYEVPGGMFQVPTGIVFSCWTSTLDLFESMPLSRNISYSRIDGKVRLQDRLRIIEEFQENPGMIVLLMTTGTGALGLNITAANRIHIVEPQWNPFVEAQAIGRALRLGQNRAVTVIRYIMKDTVEEKIRVLQQKKQHLAAWTFADKDSRNMSERVNALEAILRDSKWQ